MLSDEKLAEIAAGYAKNKPELSLSVGILTPSGITRHCFGESGVRMPVHAHTYEIGSVTKTFTAALAVQRALDLDMCVFSGVTLRQLFTHSAGIPEYPLPDRMDENPFADVTAADVRAFLADKTPGRDAPWAYSNTGFARIGMFLEEKFHCPFYRLLADFISGTLHLPHTHFGFAGADLCGHDGSHASRWQWRENSAFLPAGGLVSDLSDMMEYLRLQMQVPAFGVCHRIHWETEMPFDMGLAFMRQKDSGVVFSMGLTGGFSSFIGFDPVRQNGAVVLSNYCGYGYGNPDTPSGIGFVILNTLQAI